MFLNKAIICSNLTRDPELRYLPNTGTPVAAFSVATNRAWTDETGARQESVEFHNIIVYGNQAEPCAQYLRKGQIALIEGRLQTRSWDGQDGQKRYRTEIIANVVQFGPPRRQDDIDTETGEPDGEPRDEAATPADADREDEIPF